MDSAHLKSIPLFAQLGPREASALVEMLQRRTLDPNEALFWIGDQGDEFYVIESGKIHLTFPDNSGREMSLATLGPGDFLGELALLDGDPRTATARAVGDTVVLALNRENFLNFINTNPSAAIHIMRVLGRRQRETVDRLRGIRNVNEIIEEQTSTPWQKVADMIATAASSQYFLWIHAIAMAGWLTLNISLGPKGPDPYPFPFLCFWTSCEAIFLSMFILVSQNAQARKDRVRTDIEYQIALKMQLEVMQLHQKIDRFDTLLERLESERDEALLK
jgi:CRP/FNR family transcriptional regulator, cyclic AMP receptor protein